MIVGGIVVGKPTHLCCVVAGPPQKILVATNADGIDWFEGEGPPPNYIAGAVKGDCYLNKLTGDYYTLGD